MVDPVQVARPAPGRRRLLARLCLFAFFGGLLLLLSSRPAEAAERREPGLLGLLGSCSGSSTQASVQAGRSAGATGVRVPHTAAADVSIGTRRSRPAASGPASTSRPRSTTVGADAPATTSPRTRADASASLTRRARPLLDLDATLSLAGVGLLGSSPFTLVGDPATDNLLPTGELSLGDLTGEAPAGIGVLDTGPIAPGNQVGADVGYISPSVPVTVCGNGVGVLGDASGSCGTTSSGGIIAPPPGTTPDTTPGRTDTTGTPPAPTAPPGRPGPPGSPGPSA
jgi:hypothetical protein